MQRKTLSIFFHISVWILLYSMPLVTVFFHYTSFQAVLNILKYTWTFPAAFAIAFYINYFVLVDKLFSVKKIIFFIGANFLLIFFLRWLSGFYYFQLDIDEHAWVGTVYQLFTTILYYLLYFLIVFICVAIKMTQRWNRAEFQKRKLQENKMESEIQMLKSQLNPHFLFNTLNNIYSLVNIDPVKSQKAIQQLSEMLRYVIYDNEQKYVPLDQEISFIRNYIELMRMRYSSKVKIEVNLPDEKLPGTTIPLLFISLVENAFKHGVSSTEPSHISINFEESPEGFTFSTINSNFPKSKEDKGGSGIGIENLRKRLELCYPDKHSFTYGVKENQYISTLIVQNKEL